MGQVCRTLAELSDFPVLESGHGEILQEAGGRGGLLHQGLGQVRGFVQSADA